MVLRPKGGDSKRQQPETNTHYLAPGIGADLADPEYRLLNRNLKVPCGWPRKTTSGPKSVTLPSPTFASAIAVAPSRYSWPHAQPLRTSFVPENQATGEVRCRPCGARRKAGLLSKLISTCSGIPKASGRVLSTFTVSSEPGM